ncbi:MAG: sigma-70 family RNA polymerase sigma factor [Bacteroidota bacterium]
MTKEQFQILFDMYFEDIRSYLYFRSGDTELSTDLAQDTFLRIWEKQLTLDPEKDVGLLYKIAGDFFINQYRKDRVSNKVLKNICFEHLGPGPEEDLHYKELKAKYEKILNSLPEKQRTVFLMSRMEELTYREIAERLSISVKSVEKRMSGVLTRLRKELIDR